MPDPEPEPEPELDPYSDIFSLQDSAYLKIRNYQPSNFTLLNETLEMVGTSPFYPLNSNFGIADLTIDQRLYIYIV